MKRKDWIYWRMKSNDTRWDEVFYYSTTIVVNTCFLYDMSHSSSHLKNVSAHSLLTSTGRN